MIRKPGLILPRKKGTETVLIQPKAREVRVAAKNVESFEAIAFDLVRSKALPANIQHYLDKAVAWEDRLFNATKELVQCVFT